MGTEEVAKVEESTQISDLEQKIIRQIEYYFGNYNLSRDKFLREKMKLDDGWVPLDTMILFKRLKCLTEDFKVIGDALKKSPNNLMEVDEDYTKIRRSVEKPLPEEADVAKGVSDDRTLYVKGFKKNSTLDELLDFFKEYKAENIQMRRYKMQKNKPFKGSCFVLFETKEDADKFLANKEVKYENTELLKEYKKDYMARKDIFYENLKAEKAKKLAERQKNRKGSKEDNEKTEENKEIQNKDTYIPGCLLKVVGVGKDCSREDIKEVFDKYGTVVYVDFSRGQTEAVVRFETGIAAKALEEIPKDDEDGEKKVEVLDFKVTVTLIEGDADKEYWDNIPIHRANARRIYQQRASRGRFGNKNNWGRKKRNNRDDEGDEQPSKRQKVESNEENNGVKKESKMAEE